MRPIAQALLDALERNEPAVLATVIRTSGSTPQVVGAKLLLRKDGTFVGTVGGGRIEQVVLEAARAVLENGESRVVSKNLVQGLGMCCGGSMDIFVERIDVRDSLTLFGAGHVSQATATLAQGLGFDVHVVDEREEWNTAERFPQATRHLMAPEEAIRSQKLPVDDHAYVVITTHDHALDELALRLRIVQKHAYLGMIGSQRKARMLKQRVAQRLPNVDLTQVRSPVGIDIGARTPEEIAVSIAAELVSVRAARREAAGGRVAKLHKVSSGDDV